MHLEILEKEFHPTKNTYTFKQALIRASSKMWWVCNQGHEWKATPNRRISNNEPCPICSEEIVLIDFNDLATKYPTIAAQWHPKNKLNSRQVTGKHRSKIWWRGECGHEWMDSPQNRVSDDKGCFKCAGYKESIKSSLRHEWHPTANLPLIFHEALPVEDSYWWLGACGHEWKALASNRNADSRCPVCANRMLLQGFNDLATRNHELAAEWHPIKNGDLSPHKIIAVSRLKVWWLGKCGHEWEAVVGERIRGTNCSICTNRTVLVGFNDLLSVSPEIANEWHPTKNGDLIPNQVTAYSEKKYWWLCSEGHEWEANTSNRWRLKSGCPVCSNKVIITGFNDLKTTHPELARQWHPALNTMTPQQVSAGMGHKIWWICSKKHIWKAWIYSRTRGHGCPVCARMQH